MNQGRRGLDLCDLKYVLASAIAGTFSGAAQSLGVETSTISRRIGRLENEVGLTVFERTRTGVRLTNGGKAILVHIRRALAECDAIERVGRYKGLGQSGEIRLGTQIPPIGDPLRGLLATWREAHPKVSLRIMEMGSCDLALGLEERRLDLMLTVNAAVPSHLAQIPLFAERLVAALPAGHPLANAPSVSWRVLRRDVVLVDSWEESHAARQLYAPLAALGARFRAHGASRLSLFALVGAGFGITLTPASQATLDLPGIVFKAIDESDACVQVALSWLPVLEDPTVGRFIAFMRDRSRSVGRR
jgi:DNA-binding transcriptional LysR family regulator